MDKNNGTTRREFLEFGSAFAAAGVLVRKPLAPVIVDSAKPRPTPDSAPLTGKIALEEHFALAETIAGSVGAQYSSQFRANILDVGSGRIAEMDRGGVEISILSLAAPGIQSILSTAQAISMARRANDYLAEQITKNPKRLKGFAALPLQDPQAAAEELTRCVKELGFCGALAHGFSQAGEANTAIYYDLPPYRSFWATVQQLDVPFYLHPRPPLAASQGAYEGQSWISGSPWGFAVETSIHALRLMGSGLLDEFPRLNLVLGHMGEGLPFGMWRVDNRIARGAVVTKAKRPMSEYLRGNFYITTSGVFHTPALMDVISEVGVDRVLYSVDYPFEDMEAAGDWLNGAPLSEADRLKIGRSNAQKLFHL